MTRARRDSIMGPLLSTSEEANAESEQTDLRPVLDGIRDLRDSLESYQGLEHSLVELAKTTVFSHTMISDRLTDLREEIAFPTSRTEAARGVAVGSSPGGFIAVLGLLVVNLAGCIAIVIRRRGWCGLSVLSLSPFAAKSSWRRSCTHLGDGS